MSVRVQCVGCGRYRLDGVWARLDIQPVADWLGWCPTCRVLHEGAERGQRRREGLKLLRGRRRGYHADPDATPWDEMRKGK